MHAYICKTCGVQYDLSETEPDPCKICGDERQYVHPEGQAWTTLEALIGSGEFKNAMQQEEEDLFSIHTVPRLGIGQTAYMVRSGGFHLLWDCITYLDPVTVRQMKEWGGLHAIALSHPHYYSTQIEWAETFDVPVYIHEDDREWVTRHSGRIQYWSGEELPLSEGLTLHRLGGHFKGGAVLHWRDGAGGKGVLLTGDIIQVVADRRWVSFMYSYPNLIPLPAAKVEEIAERAGRLRYDRIYNAFHGIVREDARAAVKRSADRYVAALRGVLFDT